MSRFSKHEAEALGWRFVHNVEADHVVTSTTQGEVRHTPETHVAEKYHSVAGGPSQLIHEEGETMGKLLERIHWFEENQRRLQPESVEAVPVETSPLNLDEAGVPLRTVTVPADPSDISEDKKVIQITEEEWAARDRADVLVVRNERGGLEQITYGGSTAEVTDAYQRKLDHDAAVENARTAGEDVETEQVYLDPAEVEVDQPGATGTGLLVVRKGEESISEVFERKQEGKNEAENARAVVQQVVGPQGVAPEGQEDLVGADVQLAKDTDVESEQPRMTQDEFEAQKEALEHPEDAEEPEVDATPAAAELAEEKGVDLTEVEGTGKDGRVTKPDVEKAAE